ncbi:MAG TPA: hypothetical protein VMM93_08940 [Vicinamibacterales bacterium]|nr:hypothetical protein [Vicinamibacterales bacterium]
MRLRLACVVLSAVVLAPGPIAYATGQAATADTLPARLSDEDFWQLSTALSEPGGYFRSDNLVSNELWFQWVIPNLVARAGTGGVYVGVGPEQNFTYVAALRPKMVFITDVRRGNLHTHLMYKALFELSADRAGFISRLFTKARPQGLSDASGAADLMNAYWDVLTSTEQVYRENLKAIQDHLTRTRRLPLSAEDLMGIETVYYNFYWFGPSITYSSSTGGSRGFQTTFYDLMVATDNAGVARSFLASEESFRVIKDLHQRNLVVPVVGNFAGPTALRAVGDYVRGRGGTITAYYLSNVEQYLYQDGIWQRFCANVATLPLDDRSTFIRSTQGGGGGRGLVNSLASIKTEVRSCGGQAPPPDVESQ